MKQMQNLATKISNAIKETNVNQSKMRLVIVAFFVIQNLHIKIEQKRLASNLLHQNQTLFVIYKLVYIVLS